MSSITLTTWNLQGSQGLSVTQVANHVRDVGTDLLALQEVQREQARALARELDARSLAWGFKHWPVKRPPEGMALVGVTRPVRNARTRAITRRRRLANWRRRIFQTGLVHIGDEPLAIANVHLTPHRNGRENRARELRTILRRIGDSRQGDWVVAGDFNTIPTSELFEPLSSDGFSSAGGGPTNWRRSPSARPPDQQLDYIWISNGLGIEDVTLPVHGSGNFDRFWQLSDHLPLTARLARADQR